MNFCCHHTYNVFHLAQFIKFWQIFGIWILQELYLSSEKEKGSCWLAFTSSRNVSLGRFTLLACSGRKNCTKSIMHMQSCCFASLLNQLLLCRSHYCCCCRCLNPIFNFFSLQVSVWPKSNRTFTFTSHWLLYVCVWLCDC